MAKERQLVFRVDPELEEVVEKAAARLDRSRAIVICAALLALSDLSAEKQDALVSRYLAWRKKEPGPKRGR